MDIPTVFGFPGSTHVRTVLLTLNEKGVAYESASAPLGEPDYLGIHPYDKMPAFRDQAVHLTETVAIAAYVDRTSGGAYLFPEDPAEMAHVLRLHSIADDYLYHDVLKGRLFQENAGPETEALARRHLAALERELGDKKFFVGERLTLADLHLAPVIDYIQTKEAALLDGCPSLVAWLDSVRARPSWGETAE